MKSRPETTLIYSLTIISVIFTLLSLKFRFWDFFVPGTWHGNIGLDFFSIPGSFKNLLSGKSIFNYKALNFGPYASPYPYHPLLSILFGSWLSLFNPWISYGIFVFIELFFLIMLAKYYSFIFKNPIEKSLLYPLFLCSVPTYLMLWNAQMHIFLVIAIGFILLAIYNMENDKILNRYLLIGLLFSLFTKPLVLLLIPTLLLENKTRKSTIRAIIIYVVVSFVFIILPFLNPEGDNIFHWKNILNQANNIIDQNNFELFSLSTFLIKIVGKQIPLIYFKIPLVFTFLLSLFILKIKDIQMKKRFLTLIIILFIYVYFLSYNLIWEYHYTIILPALPFLYILQKDKSWKLNLFIKIVLYISFLLYIPTPYFIFKKSIVHHLFICRITRVGYVLISYLLIISFVIANINRFTQKIPNKLK